MKAELPEAYGSPALATSPGTHDTLCSPQAPSPQTIPFPLSSPGLPHTGHPQPRPPQSSHEESTFLPYRNHPASKVKLKILCRGSLRFFHPPFPILQHKQHKISGPGHPPTPPSPLLPVALTSLPYKTHHLQQARASGTGPYIPRRPCPVCPPHPEGAGQMKQPTFCCPHPNQARSVLADSNLKGNFNIEYM